ncbi:MAG: type I glyceraldehyde-3-phosphate dehydrogenase [Bdellovibrionaceae bacterium]|nr:type I glyceraldehyde-3-phosphate dehydrogenase [Pseudobdellovibrionaceae bacterium]
MSALRVGINGFGRIGRILYRASLGEIEVAGINNIGDIKQVAHLLKYDSTHGRFPGDVTYDESNIIVNGTKIPVSHEKDPEKIPWKQWEVNLVMECTGVFKEKSDFEKHIKAGAKRVIVSAPAPGADMTVVYGVNHEDYDPSSHHVLSNASCTTNCLAPVAKTLHEEFGIEKGMMTTIHSYTNDQRVLDTNHSDLRRARAAGVSMIPTTTGAAKAVGKVLPDLNGKIDGMAVRVPTPNVSVVDFVFESTKDVSVDSINTALRKAAEGSLKGVLAVEDEPLVSVDYMGNPNSSIVDIPNTMVMGDRMAKVFSWYDNEAGFSHRMIDLAKFMNEKGL